MNEPLPVSPRRRLHELLAIPDRLRTDAEWDELNELEISLAPGNQANAPEPRSGPRPVQTNPRPSEGGQPKKQFRKRPRKAPKPGTP